MKDAAQSPPPIHFGDFEVDLGSREIRKNGRKLKLSGQPFEVLVILLEKPGEVVTRDEFQRRLWPADTYVDFEHGLNTAVNRLRDVLGDSADRPRFVETLPRRGYRLIGKIAPTSAVVPEQAKNVQSRPWLWPTVGACIFAGLACLLLVLYLHRRESAAETTKAPAEFKVIPFTAYTGIAESPTFSPDSSQIAFAWNGKTEEGAEHKYDIYLKVTGSETLVRLTEHPADSISLAWSPDGAQIAFQRLAGSDSGVYLVPALGGPERRLRLTNAKPFGVSWSPDGQWIAFTDSPVVGGNHSLNLISVESLETKPFPHTPECQEEIEPAFSPDGKELAYRCITKPGSFALYTIDTAGRNPHLVGRYEGWSAGLTWARDNQRLVVGRHVDGNEFSELDEISVSSGQLRKLPFGERGGDPAISVRGDKLAFELWHYSGVDIWRRALIPAGVSAQKIIASTQASIFPQYSPDGKHITFTSKRTGTLEIWMSNADGTGLVQISKLNNAITGSPRWSPDGRRIVFDSRSEGRPGVYIVDIEERVPHRVRTNIDEMSQPSWSHDGKWIYFVGGVDSGRIFRCPVEGGQAEALSSQPGSIPQEAPARDEIYFVTNLVGDSTLKVISLKKPGTESTVEGMPSVNFSNWVVVPGGIFFLPNDRWSLEYFDFASRKISHLVEISGEPVMGISVSQDRRSLVYARLQQADSDIMLVEHWR